MIQFDRIKKEYGDDLLFSDVSVQLGKGERWAIVGQNGSGKTTLFRLMTEQESPDGGQIIIPKHYQLGYLTQHRTFTKSTLLEEAAQGLPDPSQTHLFHRVEEMLFGLGFSKNDLSSPPLSFSGGYQLRIQLAQVFLKEPDCLLLDEPTNYLDIVSIRWLTQFLKKWPKEFLVISHDRCFLDAIATHTVGIVRKKIRKIKGTTETFYTWMASEEEIHQRTQKKFEKKRSHIQSYVDRFGAKASKAAQAQSRIKALAKLPILEQFIRERHLNFRFQSAPFRGKKIGEAEQISFDYGSSSKPLINHFSLIIEPKTRIAIIGKNGRGKSTLLRLLAQELNPQSGKIEYSKDVQRAVFDQTSIDLLSSLQTVEETIASVNPLLSPGEVRSICGLMHFSEDRAKKRVEMLSGGEKSRVVLGKILATPANFLLLDEPTHHLDIESVEALLEAIESFPGAVILVTHSEEVLHRFNPHKCIVFRKGKQQIFLGDYEAFLEKGGWESEEILSSSEKESEEKIQRITFREQKKNLEKELDHLEKKNEQIVRSLKENEVELSVASSNADIDLLQKLTKKRKQLEQQQQKVQERWEKAFYEWDL